MRKNKRIYKQKRKKVDLNLLGPILKIAIDNFVMNLKYKIRNVGNTNAQISTSANDIPSLKNLTKENDIWINHT